MAYGQIVRDALIPNDGANHNIGNTLGVANFLAFLTQDITDNPLLVIQPTVLTGIVYVDGASKAAGVCNVVNPAGALAAVAVDAFLVTPHSILDAGPIVGMTGAGASTRTNAPPDTVRGRGPSYRSLHQVTATAANPSVTIIHNLGTDLVLPFAQPTALPVDADGGGLGVPLPYDWSFATGVGTVTLNVTVPTGAVANPITFDVMILSQLAVGHSMFQHNPAALAPRPSYQAAVFGGTGGIPPIGTLGHNLNAQDAVIVTPPGVAADAIVLFSFFFKTVPFGTPFEALGIISRNAVGGVPDGASTILFGSALAPVGANTICAVALRAHSMIVRP